MVESFDQSTAASFLLGRPFWRALNGLEAAAGAGGSPSPDVEHDLLVVHRSLDALYARLSSALEPHLGPRCLTPAPTLQRVRDYVTKGTRRHDRDLRFYAGRWIGDVKVVLHFSPAGVDVFLSSWMAGKEQSRAFAAFLDDEGARARERLLEVSRRLEAEFGVALQLMQSVRKGSHVAAARGWLEDDLDWATWRVNALGQASVGFWFPTFDPAFVLREARNDATGDPIWAAPRIIGGLAGKRAAQSAEEDLVGLVEQAATEVALASRSLFEDARLDAVVLVTAVGLGEVLAHFRRHMTRRRPRPLPPVPFDAAADEIGEALRGAVLEVERTALPHRPLLCRGDARRATMGWGSKALPWLEVARSPQGRLRLAFHAGVSESRYPDFLRPRLAARLRGREGSALLDLVQASGGEIAPTCGGAGCRKRGRCPTTSGFVDHWLVSGDRPVLEWSLSSSGGQVDWFTAPARLLTGLLLQALPHPPELVVPEMPERSWDLFVSTPGVGVGFAGGTLARALEGEHLSTWYMSDHEAAGVNIADHVRHGIEHSRAVLVVLHDSYWRSPYCVTEFLEAVRCRRPLLPALVTETGDATDVGDQLRLAEAQLAAARAEYPADVVQRAVTEAQRLLSHTIRATVREGARTLPATTVRAVVAGARGVLREQQA